MDNIKNNFVKQFNMIQNDIYTKYNKRFIMNLGNYYEEKDTIFYVELKMYDATNKVGTITYCKLYKKNNEYNFSPVWNTLKNYINKQLKKGI